MALPHAIGLSVLLTIGAFPVAAQQYCDPIANPTCSVQCDPATDVNCVLLCNPDTDPSCTDGCDPAIDPSCSGGATTEATTPCGARLKDWRKCFYACRDNLNSAIDMCDPLDWIGWGNYCRAHAIHEFQNCASACMIEWCS